MPKFRYMKQGDAAEERGQVHRVLSENAVPYLTRRLDGSDLSVSDGVSHDSERIEAEDRGEVFKFKEVSFDDWAEYIPE